MHSLLARHSYTLAGENLQKVRIRLHTPCFRVDKLHEEHIGGASDMASAHTVRLLPFGVEHAWPSSVCDLPLG